MTDASSEHEHVPHGVIEGKFVPHEKDDAEGVAEPAACEQCESDRCERL